MYDSNEDRDSCSMWDEFKQLEGMLEVAFSFLLVSYTRTMSFEPTTSPFSHTCHQRMCHLTQDSLAINDYFKGISLVLGGRFQCFSFSF